MVRGPVKIGLSNLGGRSGQLLAESSARARQCPLPPLASVLREGGAQSASRRMTIALRIYFTAITSKSLGRTLIFRRVENSSWDRERAHSRSFERSMSYVTRRTTR